MHQDLGYNLVSFQEVQRGTFAMKGSKILVLLVALGLTSSTIYYLHQLKTLHERLRSAMVLRSPASQGLGVDEQGVLGQGGGKTEFWAAPLVSVGELVVNIYSSSTAPHFLRVEMDLELFEEAQRRWVLKRRVGLKNTVIEVARLQQYESLKTLGGKLYFKELVANRINEFLNVPAVRKVHFTSFYLH